MASCDLDTLQQYVHLARGEIPAELSPDYSAFSALLSQELQGVFDQ